MKLVFQRDSRDLPSSVRIVLEITDQERDAWEARKMIDPMARLTEEKHLHGPGATISDRLFALSEMARAIEESEKEVAA